MKGRDKKNTLVPQKAGDAKLVLWSKSILAKLKLSKGSRAGIVVDQRGVPQLFVFDTPAFLDTLSIIDEALVDKLSDEEYASPKTNPAGWLIDQIEARLPPSPKCIQSLKDAINEAEKRGWIPFPKIQKSLGLK